MTVLYLPQKRGGFPAAPEAHLYPIQQFAHAPEAVGFDAPQNILRQVRHVKILHVFLCKTDRGEKIRGVGDTRGLTGTPRGFKADCGQLPNISLDRESSS